MSYGSVIARATRASLEQLQSEFEALVPRFPNLQHFYAVHLNDADVPLPVLLRDPAGGNSAMGTCLAGYTILVHGRWSNLHTPGPGAIKVWQSWFQGDGQVEFRALAERAGLQLEAFRVRLPAPHECIEILRRDSTLSEETLVLPNNIHRWPRVLHWLGWAGKVISIDRWANYHGMDMPFDGWDESRFGPRPQSFYSFIDNLFLRSAAALEWMIHGVAEGESIAETPSPDLRSENRRPKGGRPSDTNETEDRRIAEAWMTKQHGTYEELALALGKTKLDVKRAIDRHRHRAGKTKAGKSSQYR
jgi:hypothetical protein